MVEVNFAECECCGFGEECTPAYIDRVRELHHGLWMCGLCAEAVQDEFSRAGHRISIDEAIDHHMRFSRKSRSAAEKPEKSAELLIAAMLQLVRRGLETPRSRRSPPATPPWSTKDEERDAIDGRRRSRGPGAAFRPWPDERRTER